MESIQDLHEKIYAHLIKKHREDPDFRFTTRITNRYSRLKKGYWFHGNDYYLVVSFWTGTDWMNKTPNIMFVVTGDECYLEISVWDSDIKRKFVDIYLAKQIKDLMLGGKYYKYLDDFSMKTILDILDNFLETDKKTIDTAVREHSEMLAEDDNAIGFIDQEQFRWATQKIEEYRKSRLKKIINLLKEPYIIQSINIHSFGEIKNCRIENIPDGNQCIFFTGENGTGKSTILKAIGAALLNDHKRLEGTAYDIELTIGKSKSKTNTKNIKFSTDVKDIILITDFVTGEGYAAYGPYRLMKQAYGQIDIQSLSAENANNSLFGNEAPLLDIETVLTTRDANLNETVMQKRKDIIEEVVSDIIPGFNGILWGDAGNDSLFQTRFKIGYSGDQNTETAPTRAYTFDELATGARSVLGMVGDMMVRLFRLQSSDINDVGELKGIVLIDEIDIHLHPTFQKLLVAQLAATFPKVQFIISTHSPVPLLGAPDNSVFYVVKKDYEHTISVEHIDDVHVKQLTPDTILTSPIFGMQDILHTDYNYDYDKPGSNRTFEAVRTESTWEDTKIADAELDSLLRKYRQRKGDTDDKS